MSGEDDSSASVGIYPGLRRERKVIDRNIWLWSSERHASKREVQIFAKQAFEEAGISDFKASDGWYRRWSMRWKNKCKKDNQNVKTADNIQRLSKKNSNIKICKNPQENADLGANGVKCKQDLPLFKTSLKSTKNHAAADEEDCSTDRLNNKVQNEFTIIGVKKKGERYMKHFKFMVASYAASHSIKEAAQRYRVNKETVSDWMRDFNNKNFITEPNHMEPEPTDVQFIQWLKEVRENGELLNRDLLTEKVFLMNKENKAGNKKDTWFQMYARRLLGEDSKDKFHIMYPASFKAEVAMYSKVLSKKAASKLFTIDRKRILEWCQFDKGQHAAKKDGHFSCVTDKVIDLEIHSWYEQQSVKPSSKQVREKALAEYLRAGYVGMKCSEGWYTRWCARYSVPGARCARQALDSLLVTWLLQQTDTNLSPSYSRLLHHAKTIQGPHFNASLSWAVRFFKRHSVTVEKITNRLAPLPLNMEIACKHFKTKCLHFIQANSLETTSIVTFDEIPLNFLPTGGRERQESLVKKSGFENCYASMIFAYNAEGTVLTPALILKAPIESESKSVHIICQEKGINDDKTMAAWASHVLARELCGGGLVVCDAYSCHETLQPALQATAAADCGVFVIPAGCSSRLLPFSYGVSKFIKSKLEEVWCRWNYENVLPSESIKYPSDSDLLGWVELVTNHLTSHQKNLLTTSFKMTGILEQSCCGISSFK